MNDFVTRTVDGAAAFARAYPTCPPDVTLADVIEPYEEVDGDVKQTMGTVTIHRAIKDHGQNIKAGDRYVRIVTGGYTVGGARWLDVIKAKLEEGQEIPGWAWARVCFRGYVEE